MTPFGSFFVYYGMKDRQIIYIVSVLLVASVLANLYFWNNPKTQIAQEINNQVATSSQEVAIDSPYGFRNEVVIVYDNGKTKTYSTTTPLTEKDLEQMHKQTEARIRAMDDYFREQKKFFREFWYNF